MRAGTKNRQKETPMNPLKRYYLGRHRVSSVGRLRVTRKVRSELHMLADLLVLDPFQNAVQREWQSARAFLNLDTVQAVQVAARPACSNRWVSQ